MVFPRKFRCRIGKFVAIQFALQRRDILRRFVAIYTHCRRESDILGRFVAITELEKLSLEKHMFPLGSSKRKNHNLGQHWSERNEGVHL